MKNLVVSSTLHPLERDGGWMIDREASTSLLPSEFVLRFGSLAYDALSGSGKLVASLDERGLTLEASGGHRSICIPWRFFVELDRGEWMACSIG